MKKDEYKETIKEDINFDDKDEIITAIFTMEDGSANYEITVDSNGKIYKINGHSGINMIPKLFFSDFSLTDNYIDFYINYTVENDYHYTTMFQFREDGIKKVLDLQGYLESYDGNKKIYSELNQTTDKNKILISYYELDKGVVYPPKNENLYKYLQYEDKLILFSDTGDKTSSSGTPFMSRLGNDESAWKNYYKDGQVVTVTKANENLKILDIDYEAYNHNSSDPQIRNIPIKVETEDGKQGWLVWINGGV